MNSKNRFIGALALAAGLCATAGAAPLCNVVPQTSTALGTGASTGAAFCTLGTIDFGNFSVSTSGTASGALVFIGSGSNFTNGIATLFFQIVGTNNPGTIGDIIINYTATGAISALSLTLGNSSNTSINEVACNNAFNCAQNSANRVATLNVGPNNNTASATFATQAKLWISKDVSIGQLVNGQIVGGTISDFSNGHGVPEPMTLSMMGAGLLALGVLRRNKK